MLFNSSVEVLAWETTPTENGEANIALGLGMTMPINQQQVMKFVGAAVNFNLDKESLISRANEMLEIAEQLPDPPKESPVVTAQSMADVEQLAKMDKQFKGQS